MSSAAKKRPKSRVRGSSPALGLLREPSAAFFPSKEEFLKLVAVVAIAASVTAACHYAVLFLNRRPKPFCDSGGGGVQNPIFDSCEPCPDNGHCFDGNFECFLGYKKLGRKCIEDGLISQTAVQLSELLERHVCDTYARVLCNQPGKIWFQEADIRSIIDEHKTKKYGDWKDETFTLAKHRVTEAAESLYETRTSQNDTKEFKCPELLAEFHKPMHCRIRQWCQKYALALMTSFVLLLGLMRFLMGVHKKHKILSRAEELYAEVCEILEGNSTSTGGEPWVVASWIRDHLLLPRERKHQALWKKVEELIQEDSRIAQYPKLVKGESKVVWEWQVDELLSSTLKKKVAKSKARTGANITSSDNKEPQLKVGKWLSFSP